MTNFAHTCAYILCPIMSNYESNCPNNFLQSIFLCFFILNYALLCFFIMSKSTLLYTAMPMEKISNYYASLC